jgi:DNA replication protein DnaC
MTASMSGEESLAVLLRALKLPTVARHADDVAAKAEREGWTFIQYMRHLVALEVEERRRRRIDRNLRISGLPTEKTLAMLDRKRLPAKVAKMLPTLCEGAFIERGDNVLLFGLPGRGKTHVVCAVGHELVRRGHRVLFTPTYALVQRLLAAKRELSLEKELDELDGYDAVILDDIGYVQQNRDEMEVLFTFLAERYERRSVLITSNLVFSEWDRIFKDPMTTAAAIDRIVHHAVIIEMTGTSVRAEAAEGALKEASEAPTTTASDTTKEVTFNAPNPKAAKPLRRRTKPKAATTTMKKSRN